VTMDNIFNSQTYGILDLKEVHEKIIGFISKSPGSKHQLVIGSDSQSRNGEGTDFVTAIVVHRTGEGGIYFWRRVVEERKMVLRTRIYKEASLSLEYAQRLLDTFRGNGITKYDLEIHVDIGKHGETREMLAEVVGMIRGSGFIVKTKPEAYGASKVADRHT